MSVLISVVVPMFNEVENAERTLARIGEALAEQGWEYELVPVNDGSLDDTAMELERLSKEDPRIRPVIYRVNRGRGYALRRGFAAARGDIICALDADLSYTPDHAVRMTRMLLDDSELDMVIASPYMPGGTVEGVPLNRLLISRLGNIVLSSTLPQRIYTSTCVTRAYRAHVLHSLDLASDGKEIHLEILSNAMALGYRIVEMPATLRARTKGSSKFRPGKTMQSHLAFTLLERSAVVFVWGGAALLLLSIAIALYLLVVFLGGGLNPERPLMSVMVMLFVGGAVGLSFALLAMLLLDIRRTLVRLQADMRALAHHRDADNGR